MNISGVHHKGGYSNVYVMPWRWGGGGEGDMRISTYQPLQLAL